MEKRNYVKPILNSETFLSSEYISACKYEISYVGYCNISGDVYLDTNGNETFDPGIDQYKYGNTACDEKYESSTQPHTNAFVVEGFKKTTKYCDNPDKYTGHYSHNCETIEYSYTKATPVFNYKDYHVTANYDSNPHKNVS